MVPWPISEPALMMVTVPFGAIRTQLLYCWPEAGVFACASPISLRPSVPSARPNDRPPKPASTLRRESSGDFTLIVMAQPSFDACSTAARIL